MGGDAMDKMKERISSESKSCIGVQNKNMVCADCVQRYDDVFIPANATRCEAYPSGKPLEIVFGETKKCPEYTKE